MSRSDKSTVAGEKSRPTRPTLDKERKEIPVRARRARSRDVATEATKPVTSLDNIATNLFENKEKAEHASVFGLGKLFSSINGRTIHIIAEIIVFLGVIITFNSKTKSLKDEISILRAEVSHLKEQIKNQVKEQIDGRLEEYANKHMQELIKKQVQSEMKKYMKDDSEFKTIMDKNMSIIWQRMNKIQEVAIKKDIIDGTSSPTTEEKDAQNKSKSEKKKGAESVDSKEEKKNAKDKKEKVPVKNKLKIAISDIEDDDVDIEQALKDEIDNLH